jgi:hypothetical protein
MDILKKKLLLMPEARLSSSISFRMYADLAEGRPEEVNTVKNAGVAQW